MRQTVDLLPTGRNGVMLEAIESRSEFVLEPTDRMELEVISKEEITTG